MATGTWLYRPFQTSPEAPAPRCLIYSSCRNYSLHAQANEHMRALLNRFQNSQRYGIENRIGLTEEEIESIPTRTINSLDEESHPSCSICITDLKSLDEIRDIPCHHLFHKACLDEWLGMKDTCPNCVQRVLVTDATNLI